MKAQCLENAKTRFEESEARAAATAAAQNKQCLEGQVPEMRRLVRQNAMKRERDMAPRVEKL